MKKEIAAVKNPLTVISIFAGLAEVAGTVVLPFIAETNQITFIWFIMVFPVFLVTLFFLTLNFNPRVLYAPSDFDDEQNYMDLFRPSSTRERLDKLDTEVSQEAAAEQPVEDAVILPVPPSPTVLDDKEKLRLMMNRDAKSRYMLAEGLILDKLSSEFAQTPKSGIVLQNKFGNMMFDAAFEDSSGLVLVEIKLVSAKTPLQIMREILNKIRLSLAALPIDARKSSRFLLAVAHELPTSRIDEVQSELEAFLRNFPIKAEVRMFDLADLIESS